MKKTLKIYASLFMVIIAINNAIAQSWSITGNAGTNSSTNFIGTTDNVAFKIRTKNTVRITVTNQGKVGIGTTTPAFKLDVNADVSFNGVRVGRGNGDFNTNTAVGYISLDLNSTGQYNTGTGYGALYYNLSGNYNSAYGLQSLFENIDGSNNTASGYHTLFENTSGFSNTAIGCAALSSNTIKSNLVAVGDSALFYNGLGAQPFNSNATQNTAVGSKSLMSNTLGSWNTAVGFWSLKSNTYGTNNTANGNGSLYSNTTGSENTSTGAGSLANNSIGWNNTANGSSSLLYNIGSDNSAFGANSLLFNTTGYSNVAIGIAALLNNTEGHNLVAVGDSALYNQGHDIFDVYANTAIGSKSLFYNTTGDDNTATGANSLFSNYNGSSNTANGYAALYSNTSGGANSSFGLASLYYNSSGKTNCAFGLNSLYNNDTGDYNVAVGSWAAYSNNYGDKNTAIGYFALSNNTTGSYNTAIGTLSNVGSGALTNATAIGYNATVVQSNSLVLGDTNSVNVGIGTGAPKTKLHIRYLSNINTPHILLQETSSSYARLNFANAATTNIFAVAAIPSATNANAKMNFYYSPTGDIMTVEGDGRVGIGTTTPAYKLQLSTNSAAKPTSSAWTVPSDMRLKKDVKAFTDGIEILNQVNPVWFTYTGDGGMPANDKGIGTIAQELQKVAPYMVKEWTYRNEKDNSEQNYLGVDYGAMDFILVNSIKEQQKQIEEKDDAIKTLQSTLGSLQNENEKQQQQIDEIKNAMKNFEMALSQCCSNYEMGTSKNNSQNNGSTDKAILQQNVPNPFNQSTVIKYYLPSGFHSAQIIVASEKGQILKMFELKNSGNGEVTINSNELATGNYLYSLMVDEKKIDTKQLTLTK